MLVDTSLNYAFAIKYLVYAIFGVVGTIFSVPVIANVGGTYYESIWCFSITILAVLSAYRVWKNAKLAVSVRDMKKEIWLTLPMNILLSLYGIFMTVLVLNGDLTRLSLAVLAYALVVMPTWRVVFLVGNIRNG
ncbi:holin/anti-holin [Clavibacter phage CN1A]|uniref:Holin/anti-holin n=1 Tax=Clavibacter phage CN1A TaxID=1406793 RepID=U5PTD9_9CAUD|nr:holin/anti-holin [Clavibacter phage CN1A]AGY47144.1 holin/anti-holin [Clavibacter phage CN1A]